MQNTNPIFAPQLGNLARWHKDVAGRPGASA
jgi:hypothetical protein